MLPFLRKKQDSAALASPIESEVREPDEGSESEGLMQAARELCAAVKADDHHGVVQALQSAFELMDGAPHMEGPHIESEE